MAQMTTELCAEMLTHCDRKLQPPLTVNETAQLLHAWLERETLRGELRVNNMQGKDRAEWLAEKICNGGDYAKEAAIVLVQQATEIDRLHALLERCRPFIESDVQMIADISRHAPLDAASQAVHDSTEYPSERLLRDILATLGPNAKLMGGLPVDDDKRNGE